MLPYLVHISLLYSELEWNSLLEYSSKTFIDGVSAFSRMNLAISTCSLGNFPTQPHTGLRAKVYLGQRLLIIVMLRQQLCLNFREEACILSPIIILPPLFPFKVGYFLATSNSIQGYQGINKMKKKRPQGRCDNYFQLSSNFLLLSS